MKTMKTLFTEISDSIDRLDRLERLENTYSDGTPKPKKKNRKYKAKTAKTAKLAEEEKKDLTLEDLAKIRAEEEIKYKEKAKERAKELKALREKHGKPVIRGSYKTENNRVVVNKYDVLIHALRMLSLNGYNDIESILKLDWDAKLPNVDKKFFLEKLQSETFQKNIVKILSEKKLFKNKTQALR